MGRGQTESEQYGRSGENRTGFSLREASPPPEIRRQSPLHKPCTKRVYNHVIQISGKGDSMRILLLEDDAILSDLIYDYLCECGYDTTLCMDGREALATIDAEQFDLFLFDINVPYINGIDLLREVRSYHRQTPAIFITAYQDLEHLKKGFTAGCDDYIKKPFELEELEERINNIKKRYHIEAEQAVALDGEHTFDHEK
ncbi:MAG TPA: response regulator transcription factor, partial [Campylobacteraceae bacterium]|nr:response regulator transcription factor [Campylobacteraceae bacterium]